MISNWNQPLHITPSMSSTIPPPPYFEVAQFQAPPSYSDGPGEDLSVQLEQMKAEMEQMRLEKGAMMWKMHLEKVEMMAKMDRMRLEKEAVTEQVRLEKDTVIEQMRLEKDTVIQQMRLESEKHIHKEEERVQTEKKEFIAKEKHWSSDFDSWNKQCSMPTASKQMLQSIVPAFLKTIPTEMVYAIHSITCNDYGRCQGYNGPSLVQYSQVRLYIATDSKVYTLDYSGDVSGTGINGSFSSSSFRAIVTFPSEPTPTFWRAVFSQMRGYDTQGPPMDRGNSTFHGSYGNNEIFRVATAKLEALFTSFR